MALFKIYRGVAAELPTKKTDGYAYFTTDDGMLYIDINDNTRVKVNARGAENLMIPDEEGRYQYIEADQFVTLDDTIEVAHGGTGLTTLDVNAILIGNGTDTIKMITIPANSFVVGDATNGVAGKTASEARALLDVYTKEETDAKVKDTATVAAYTATLSSTGWTNAGSEFSQAWNETALACGKDGTVPPIISFTDNQEEYSKIDRAEATPKQGITFYTKTQPNQDIGIVIIDVM